MKLLSSVASCALLLSAHVAFAEPIVVRDGRFDAVVSADQMSRISVQNDRIVSVRSMGEPDGPQMLIEAEETTGDVYVAFDGAVPGQVFTAFLVTASGRTVQATLTPTNTPGQTVIVNLGQSAGTPTQTVDRTERRVEYMDPITALMRVMFVGYRPEGVACQTNNTSSSRAAQYELRVVQTCTALGLRGQIIEVTNRSAATVPVLVDSFLIAGVLAAASDRDELMPNASGRVFIVEEAR